MISGITPVERLSDTELRDLLQEIAECRRTRVLADGALRRRVEAIRRAYDSGPLIEVINSESSDIAWEAARRWAGLSSPI